MEKEESVPSSKRIELVNEEQTGGQSAENEVNALNNKPSETFFIVNSMQLDYVSWKMLGLAFSAAQIRVIR